MLITERLIIPPAHIIIKMHLYSVMAPGDPVQRHCYKRKKPVTNYAKGNGAGIEVFIYKHCLSNWVIK